MEGIQSMKNGKAKGPDDIPSGGMEMSRRECTEVWLYFNYSKALF